ncbi:galactose-3-O-sulfotransferase 2-like [Convolutriloba macropyga]|uniref:galactose-3-O-sulfotransferase 2-like n=1 Tax=Convolutriloba macropyga TaxID=536237 RepID=UPI003F524189
MRIFRHRIVTYFSASIFTSILFFGILTINLQYEIRELETVEDPNLSSQKTPNICKPVTSFGFVKNHKCGTMTLTTMFLRVADDHNLEIALPNNSAWKIDWPDPPKNLSPSRKPNRKFDVLVLHTMYQREIWDKIMETGYKRISILRSPYKQFKSYFVFFQVDVIVRYVNSMSDQGFDREKSQFDQFLENPEKYYNYMYSATKNVQAYNFGYNDTEKLEEKDRMENLFVKKLENEFDLMLITDYMNESLVLLKEHFCWNLKDVLSTFKNEKRRSVYYIDEETEKRREEIYRSWASLDYKLFDTFNKTFWRKIGKINNFQEKIASYREIADKVGQFCNHLLNANRQNVENKERVLIIDQNKNYWRENFTIDEKFCTISALKTINYVPKLQMARYGKSQPKTADSFLNSRLQKKGLPELFGGPFPWMRRRRGLNF